MVHVVPNVIASRHVAGRISLKFSALNVIKYSTKFPLPKKPKMKNRILPFLACVITLVFSFSAVAQEKLGGYERQRGLEMLKQIKDDLKNKYYDTGLRGIDLDAKFAAASEKMKNASSIGQVMGIIAQLTLEFNDSHTFFVPPARVGKTQYGWKGQMIGDHAFVTAIKPNSDAEAKGLKVGDEVVAIDNYTVDRGSFWLMKYYYYTLRPQPGMKLRVRHPDGKEEDMIALAKITAGKKLTNLTGSDGGIDLWNYIRDLEQEDYLVRARTSVIDDVFVWEMPEFDLDESQIDSMMDRASKHKAVVLDLRKNPGGAVTTLNRLVGNFFDHDVKIADWKGRKKFAPQVAKTRGGRAFKGDLVVLIDSESASAAEIFARVIQLEKRGTIMGDMSSGKVMVSRFYDHQSGIDTVAFYGASVTEADLIMTDGKSLENNGVAPDKPMLPSAADMAAGRDPLLAAAVALCGGKLDAVDAGKLFPVEWPK